MELCFGKYVSLIVKVVVNKGYIFCVYISFFLFCYFINLDAVLHDCFSFTIMTLVRCQEFNPVVVMLKTVSVYKICTP